jgi:Tol biopolymer transport system component
MKPARSVALVVAAFTVVSIAEMPAGTAFRGDNGRIVFSERTGLGSYEVLSVEDDGSGRMNLTKDPSFDSGGVWSPDGTRIAFSSTRDFNDEIYAMDADGTNVTRLTRNRRAIDIEPAWSPDGTQIAFMSTRDAGGSEIYVMNADGSEQTRVTVAQRSFETEPAWSPDGRLIAFVSDRDGDRDIWTVKPNGRALTNLTSNRTDEFSPSWSPGGTQIAFASDRDGKTNIYKMKSNGAMQTRLTSHPRRDSSPAWSPDGTKIAFSSGSSLYTMDTDGNNVQSIVEGIGWEPSWRPVVP